MTTLQAHHADHPTGAPAPSTRAPDAAPHATTLAAEAAAIDAARASPEAFQSIYDAHYRVLAQYLYRRTADAALAETLAAQTLSAAWRGLPRFQTGQTPIRCWLLRIATNELRAHRRGLARLRRRLDGWVHRRASRPPQSPDSCGVELADDAAAALRALHSLPAKYRDPLCLYHLADLSVEHVALTLNCPPGTVKSLLSRGRELLRQRLEPDLTHWPATPDTRPDNRRGASQ